MTNFDESRAKYSLYNAFSAIMLTLVNGLLGIVVTRLIIGHFGSDYNGLNSTANQIINVLLLMEGGFTLASTVALFRPLSQNDYVTSNSILNATKRIFKRIGFVFLVIGIIVAIVYSMFVKTTLPREFVFTLLLMAVVPQVVNFYYTTPYRILLQSQQKEFVINGFTAITIGFGHIVNIFIVSYGGEMWMIRFVTMFFAILNCLMITGYTKNENNFLDFSIKADYTLIHGTKDVMAQKITGALYSSWPMIFLTVSPSGGTILASVYAVYNSVFMILKALLHGVIDAPRLGFGDMLPSHSREEVWTSFRKYEFIAVFFIFITMLTAFVLILPFISLYTHGVADANYYDKWIALLMTLIGTFEMLHIPSGHLINMSGHFKISKNFQFIACAVLIISMFFLGSMYSVHGMLLALLVVAILLTFLEVTFIHSYFFSNKVKDFVLLVLHFIIFGFVAAIIEKNIFDRVDTLSEFILSGFIVLVLNIVIALCIGWMFYRTDIINLFDQFKRVTKKIVQ